MPSKTTGCVTPGCPRNGYTTLKGHCISCADANPDLPRCDFDRCPKAAKTGGLCSTHYQQQYTGKTLTPIIVGATCIVPGCPDKVKKHVPMCTAHIAAGLKLKRAYGITMADKVRMYTGACEGCLDPCAFGDLVVDHCHDTGRVRGLLCAGCNKSAGLMRDNATKMRRLADYLDRTQVS